METEEKGWQCLVTDIKRSMKKVLMEIGETNAKGLVIERFLKIHWRDSKVSGSCVAVGDEKTLEFVEKLIKNDLLERFQWTFKNSIQTVFCVTHANEKIVENETDEPCYISVITLKDLFLKVLSKKDVLKTESCFVRLSTIKYVTQILFFKTAEKAFASKVSCSLLFRFPYCSSFMYKKHGIGVCNSRKNCGNSISIFNRTKD